MMFVRGEDLLIKFANHLQLLSYSLVCYAEIELSMDEL